MSEKQTKDVWKNNIGFTLLDHHHKLDNFGKKLNKLNMEIDTISHDINYLDTHKWGYSIEQIKCRLNKVTNLMDRLSNQNLDLQKKHYDNKDKLKELEKSIDRLLIFENQTNDRYKYLLVVIEYIIKDINKLGEKNGKKQRFLRILRKQF